MTIEQPAFGERVREIRRAQGMSQGDLAGDGVSPSYVSLVESGRRSPSTKAAKAIAERLGMSLEELTAPRPADRERTHRLELVGQLVAARASQAAGDWPAARRQLETVAGRAADNDLDEVRWEARWELAAVLDQLGAADDRERVLRTLLDDPLTTAAPLLRSQIAAELSQLHRRQGRLAEAVRRAEDAQSAAADVEAARPARVQAQVALLSAYVESGEWHRAQGLADTLLDEAPSAGAARLRAIALWAAAGARYLDGRADAAHELLTEADELLAATDDVRQRTRLARARTLLALACDAPGADALLERVRQAAALLATPETLSWLAALEVLDALRASDAERALEQAGTIPVDSPALPALDQARCVLIRARAQRAAGREAAAEADFRTAASGYEAAGAYRLAMATWRELSDPGHLTGARARPSRPHRHRTPHPPHDGLAHRLRGRHGSGGVRIGGQVLYVRDATGAQDAGLGHRDRALRPRAQDVHLGGERQPAAAREPQRRFLARPPLGEQRRAVGGRGRFGTGPLGGAERQPRPGVQGRRHGGHTQRHRSAAGAGDQQSALVTADRQVQRPGGQPRPAETVTR